MDRFWEKVDKSGECWLWTAYTTKKGYGQTHIGGKTKYAHRVAYELSVGPIPDGKELDHLCRNRACVNPDHLDPVDHATNVGRGDSGKYLAERMHCPNGHPYSGENLYVGKQSHGGVNRRCRECKREQQRRRRANKSAA